MSDENNNAYVNPSSSYEPSYNVNEYFTNNRYIPITPLQPINDVHVDGFPPSPPVSQFFPDRVLEDVGNKSSYNTPSDAMAPPFMPSVTLNSPFNEESLSPLSYNTTSYDSYTPVYGVTTKDISLPPSTHASYPYNPYATSTIEHGETSKGGNTFISPSNFEGLSLETDRDDLDIGASPTKRRKSVLESLTLPTLERRSVGFAEGSPRRSFVDEHSPRRSFIDDVSPVSIERTSFSESPDISRGSSLMEVVSFLPSVPQPVLYEDVSTIKPKLPNRIVLPSNQEDIFEGFPPSPAKRKSIIDGIPAPARISTSEIMLTQLSTLPDNRKSTLFAFDRFYSIKEEDAKPTHHTVQDRSNISAHMMHKSPMVIGAQRDTHLLSTHQLVAITCFAVAGGPFGFEDTILAGGAALTLLGLFIFPVFWSAPIALMTAELSCMMPVSGGHVLWVYRAFGPFWSFINSFFAFTCSILDNALYPALFVEYVGVLFYDNNNPIDYGWAVTMKIFVVTIAAIINIVGVDIVGTSAIVLGVGVLAPFVIMCLLGIFHLNFSWTSSENIPATIKWGKFISVLLWNTAGFDAAGTCAAEVKNPAQSYPQALTISVGLILGVYGLPSLIGASVVPNYQDWQKGTYIIAAKKIGGQFLNILVGLSAILSALGLLLTRLCTNSRIVYGMALVDQLPPVFTKIHPKFATPWAAIALTSALTWVLSGFGSYTLYEADMLFYAISTILKFSALVQLRFAEPDAFRAYKIPLETWPLALLTLIPISFCITMIFVSSDRAHGIALAWFTIAIGAYVVKELAAQHGIQAEEVVQQRMQRVQKNINQMQKRIDYIIDKEVKSSMETIGHALHIHGSSHHSAHDQSPPNVGENKDTIKQVNYSSSENMETYEDDIESAQQQASNPSSATRSRQKSLHRLAASSSSSSS